MRETINFYLENAKLVREGLTKLGLQVYGGKVVRPDNLALLVASSS